MAGRIDDDLVKDAKAEHKKHSSKNGTEHNTGSQGSQGAQSNTGEESSKKSTENNSESTSSQSTSNSSHAEPGNSSSSHGSEQPNTQPEVSPEFKQKFEEYFKGAGSIVAGSTIVEMMDDLKTNFFYIYAKKNGVDIPREGLKMDPKTKEFSAFLIDHAIKNKLFGWIEKYPLAAAGGVMLLSTGTTYLFIEMMKKTNAESEAMKMELENLRKQKQEWERKNASEATIVE